MKEKLKLSILVPVYKTAEYIENCLDSIINQTRQEIFEIIIVNDGSPDNSKQIIEKYQKKHLEFSNISYYEKENEGIAKTRNFAIQKAQSPYILFVDSDDSVEPDLVEKIEPYLEQKIDMIKFKLQRVNKEGNIIDKVDGPLFEKETGEEAFNKLYSKDVLLDSPCVYVIKKELFKENNYTFKRTYHEDFGLIPLLLLSAKTVVSLPYYLYNYIQVEDSITRGNDYQKRILKMEDALEHYDNMLIELEKLKLSKLTEENVKIYYTNAIILKLNELKKIEQKEYIKEINNREMYKNIKARNLKQMIKKIILRTNIKLYLKLR